ncbi:MAG: HD domain-containing protein [Lachnospiraceae bacterium]|nr:HD domain-containing protein [Lachnospiraceae bacterium]
MRFVRTEDLAKGMRLAKPIYNKNGVLLYDRDTRLTKQGINSIKNFGIIGIFILEPAEPLPPMTEDDLEFERFQTMSVFGLKEDLEMLLLGKKPVNIENLIKIITKNYCRNDKKVSFMQNIRSREDYVYKHSLNVAIMAAMMGVRLKMKATDIRYLVYAALVHDIGRLTSENANMANGEVNKSKEDILKTDQKSINLLADCDFVAEEVKTILNDKFKIRMVPNLAGRDSDSSVPSKILYIAELYDDLTAMKLGEEPTSDVIAVRMMLGEEAAYDSKIVGALVDSIKILYPGTCVELTNGYTGLVIKKNREDVLRPIVLSFVDNNLYNLEEDEIFSVIQIRDIMKTMDKRVKIDKETIETYLKQYN